MSKTFRLVSTMLIMSVAACQSNPAPIVAGTTLASTPTARPLTGYRPLQNNDLLEGAKIGYLYTLPSPEQPAVTLAFGENMLELVSIKPELRDGLLAYIRDLVQEPRSVYAFDENTPDQAEPKLLLLPANRPIEIVFIPIAEGQHNWSVTETDQGEIRAAYKLVRRKDGGLRFVDAYGIEAMNSFTTLITLNGGGAGLVYSARLALLRLILSEPTYQRGADVMASQPPQLSQYDSRILKLDPTQTGLAQDLDWVLVSRPGPNPGLPAP
jgi:hypothetical protein